MSHKLNGDPIVDRLRGQSVEQGHRLVTAEAV